jgi:Cu/Ag efflux pump CusA
MLAHIDNGSAEQNIKHSSEELKLSITEGITDAHTFVNDNIYFHYLGLLRVRYGTYTGTEVLGRIAEPMVDDMMSNLVLTLIVLSIFTICSEKMMT